MSQFAVDADEDLVLIDENMLEIAVLVEPLSVVEKAVTTALAFHQGQPKTALVIGAGPVGTLAALVLRLRGLDCRVRSLESEDHPTVGLLRGAGVQYLGMRSAKADIVVEATGAPTAGFSAVASLEPLGVCTILGARNGDGPMPFLDMIVGNHVVFGSVNASPADFQQAVEDLPRLPVHGMIERRSKGSIVETLTGRPDSALKFFVPAAHASLQWGSYARLFLAPVRGAWCRRPTTPLARCRYRQ